MPEPLHPPYNVFQPRQLNRWLDVNSQNGPLGRTRGFISIPLDKIGNITGAAQPINLTNNFGNVVRITFTLQDSNSTALENIDVAAIGGVGAFNNINYCKHIYYEAGVILTFPYEGWTGNIVFNADETWTLTPLSYGSQKMLQFNFSATRNFSLKNDVNLKAFLAQYEGKVCITICNIFANGRSPNKVVRYKLTQSGLANVNAEQYIGQQIKAGYFQIEFWSISNYIATLTPLAAPIILNTSVLGMQDYRNAVDFQLHPLPSVAVTNFNNTSTGTFDLPLTFAPNTINGTN